MHIVYKFDGSNQHLSYLTSTTYELPFVGVQIYVSFVGNNFLLIFIKQTIFDRLIQN